MKIKSFSSLIIIITFTGLISALVLMNPPLIIRFTGSSLIADSENFQVFGSRVNHQGDFFIPVRLSQVSKFMIQSTLAAEDRRFYKHCGVDFLAMARALFQNITHAKTISGASTITMQVIRLLNPKKRTCLNKLREIIAALILECKMSKNEILELYFNLAPYGGNRIGIEAAGRKYFDKPAKDISLAEAAFLAGIPQSPSRFNPLKNPSKTLKRREYVFKRLCELEIYPEELLTRAMLQKIRLTPVKESDLLITDFYIQNFGSSGGLIRTTINLTTQKLVDETLNEKKEELKSKGIDACAAVVIDVKESSLAALYSSMDVQNPLYGSINCALSKRQPGSLLKPFLYTLAFDRGILAPRSIVWDVPSVWDNYIPQNADKTYMGPMPASMALYMSRNVPAVKILEQTGTDNFKNILQGLDIIKNSKAGLSLALGTEESTLLQIANAYAALARMGIYKNLRIFTGEETQAPKKIFSAAAVYLTLQCLGNNHALPFKTGTSWHQRDAWAVILSPDYVVGIFCGKMSGIQDSYLKGSEAAFPIALSISEKLRMDGSGWKKPGSVRIRKVCAFSGAVLTQFCPDSISGEYISAVSPDLPCQFHTADTSLPFKIVFPVLGATYIKTDKTPDQMMDMVIRSGKAEPLYWFLDGELIANTIETHVKKPISSGRHVLTISNKTGAFDEIYFNLLNEL